MSTTAFRVCGNVWATSDESLPNEAVVEVPSWLTDIGFEDFEPDREEDVEDDDDEYEPSEGAIAEFEAAWGADVRELLEQKFGVAVASFAEFGPACVSGPQPTGFERAANLQ